MIAAVVATRNEGETIGQLVSTLNCLVDRVIVSDQSDTNATRVAAATHGARVISASERGIGPSLIRAWQEALCFGATRIVQIDAGGSHDPGDLPALLRSEASVVIGSRFLPTSEYVGRQWRSRASRLYGYSMYARSGLPVHDWTSGYRVFTALAAKRLSRETYNAAMHGFQAEVLLHAHRLGFSVEEVPIRYQAGDSALRLPHVWEALKVR